MTTTIALAAAAIVAGYLWIGARHWKRMMGARVLTLVDDPSDPEFLFHAAWVRGDPRVRLFQFIFVALWPACLAIGAINAAIESRCTPKFATVAKGYDQ
jgi:hypothetical protein